MQNNGHHSRNKHIAKMVVITIHQTICQRMLNYKFIVNVQNVRFPHEGTSLASWSFPHFGPD